jgi:hypothetical protein
MGIPDGAHTHGGGFGLGDLLAGAGVLLIVAALAGPVAAAVGALVHLLLVVAGILLAVAAGGLVAYVLYRRRHPRPVPQREVTARQQARQLPPQPRAIEQHVHHHWHGVTAEQVAAILRHQEARDE